MNVRVLHAADLPKVALLEQEVQLDPWTRTQVLEIAPLLDSEEYTGAVVEQAGNLVAYVIARTIFDECEILSVGVVREMQGRGLGKLVLTQLFGHLSAQIVIVHLEVRVSNLAALKLYEGLGFVEVGRRKGYYAPISTATKPEREDARLMSKRFAQSNIETTP